MARKRMVYKRPVTVQELIQGMHEKSAMTYEPMPLNLDGITCQEARPHFKIFIACDLPAEALVWHEKDRRVYPMCKACAWHNLRNRGGRLLAGDRRLLK